MDSLEEFIWEKALAEGATQDEAWRKVEILREALGVKPDDGNDREH